MKNTILKGSAGLIILLLLGGTFWLLRDGFLLNPFQADLPFEYPGFAAADAGNTYLIDRSLKRIVKTNADGELAWTIQGGSRSPGTFFFADELTIDDKGFVYVLNRVPDAPGFYTVLTQILRFKPDGTFDQVIAEKAYGLDERLPTLVQRGQWHSLQTSGDQIRWFDSNAKNLILHGGRAGSITETVIIPDYPADLMVPSAAVLPDGGTVVVTKQGRITRIDAGSQTNLYDASGSESTSVPWKIRAFENRLFFTDLARNGVAELLADGTAPLRFSTNEATSYSLSSGQEVLATTGDAGPKFFRPEGTSVAAPESARYSLATGTLHLGLWLLLAAVLVVLVFLGRLVYVEGFKRVIPPFLKTVAGVILLTAIVGGLVSTMILNNFSQRYSTEVLNKITQLVHLVPRIIDADHFTAVTEPSQFGGPEYLALRQQIIGAIYGDKSQENQGLYFALHRVSGSNLSTFMYLNGDTTIHHPFSYLNDPEGPYQKALKGETVAQYALDAWGSWMYSTGPIRDKAGTIVGVFEMGGDLYSFTQENNRLIQNLLVSILTVLVIFLLVLVELTFLQDQLRKRSLEQVLADQGLKPRRIEDVFHRVFLVRSVTGLFFVAASVSLLFLPLMMKGFYQPLWGLPENVVYGLPVSLRLFFFGLGTVLGGNLTRRWGWRPVFLAGLAVSALGLIVAALSADMTMFLISSIAIGLGAGFGMIGMRSLVNAEADPDTKATAYSHFYAGIIAGTNVGVIVGSALADMIGFANVFWLALALTVSTLFIVLKLFPKPAKVSPPAAGDLRIGQALGMFFANPAVGRFALLIILPVYVASMVLYFFLPVFAQEQGVNNADIGRIFLLNGLVVVYLGPALSQFLQSKLGIRRSLLTSSVLWTLSLLPFVITGSLAGLVATVILMGIAEGVAAVAQNEHLLSLPVSGTVGNDRAAGFFEVVAKIGETAAPILIGFAMLLGPQWGIGLVTGVLALALVVFWITDKTAQPREARS